MEYRFHMPVKLVTGIDCIEKNAELLGQLGKRCLIVTGKNSAVKSGALADVQSALEKMGIAWSIFNEVQQNPLLEDSYRAGRQAKDFCAQFIVGIGGGSPLDTAKAAAVYATNEIALMDIYKMKWPHRPLPIVTVGTTAGTGSEVAPYAVMTTPEGRKNSFASPDTYATLAFGDPKYTYSLPRKFTVSTALDALSHALEAYFSLAANELTDLFALQGAAVMAKGLAQLATLEESKEVPHSLRDELYHGSIMAGVALGQCGTCYCHRLSYFLSEEHAVPHGVACAVYLPGFLKAAQHNLPEKSAYLYNYIGFSLDELCLLIEQLARLEHPVKLSEAEIMAVVTRSVGTKNMNNTAPAGCSEKQAREILTSLFGG